MPVRVAEPDTEIDIDSGETMDEGSGDPRIRCPKCDWSPQAKDRWICKCRHVWNTFDTGGICPACLYQWKVTQCLACQQVSAHSDWYV
jgi:hypothetical protein